MEITLKRIASDTAEASYRMLVDQVVIGRVERRKELGRNLTRSYVDSGSHYDGRTRRAKLWNGVVDCADLDEHNRRAIQRHVTRPKTNHIAAAQHLVEAFAKAEVAVPVGQSLGQPR
jgi:hypothetical protein